MDNNFNNLSLVQLVFKWKWHIIIITLVAALCGAIFSSSTFITPLYKSEAIAYPANISPYSDESETEQMLQIINSQSIIDSIVEKYDLWTDYKIDRNYQYAKTYLMLEYHDKIKISKTPYEAVSIVVNDKDPVVACNIAKDILYFYDQKVAKMHRDKVGEVVAMYERQLNEKQRGIDSLKRQLSELGVQYGVSNYSGQLREITRGYINGSPPVRRINNVPNCWNCFAKSSHSSTECNPPKRSTTDFSVRIKHMSQCRLHIGDNSKLAVNGNFALFAFATNRSSNSKLIP